MQNVIICFSIMFVYTTLMLNGIGWSAMRPFLTGMGISAVVIGIPIAYGMTSLIGYPFMPHFAVLPFLMIGLGIDDMFVIMKTYRNLESSKDLILEEKIAITLKHAGVSITVTSLTDVCVFAVGASDCSMRESGRVQSFHSYLIADLIAMEIDFIVQRSKHPAPKQSCPFSLSAARALSWAASCSEFSSAL